MKKLKHVWWSCPICNKKIYVPEFIVKETKINPCDDFDAHRKITQQKLYDSIPQEKRQRFLDNFHKGMSIGESYKEAGLTQEEGFVILDKNIDHYAYLRTEAK